jgi:hypothetical protein
MWRWDRGGMQLYRDTRTETAEDQARAAETPAVAVAPVIMLMDRRPRVLLGRAERRAA